MQTFDLADRTAPTTGALVDKAIDLLGAEIFASAPFDKPAELSGLFGGRLAFVTNKKDFDVQSPSTNNRRTGPTCSCRPGCSGRVTPGIGQSGAC